MRKYLLIIIFLAFCSFIFADEVKKNPIKSATLSLFIPGAGQFYNEQFIKSGVIIALESSFAGLAIYHHLEAEKYYDKGDLNNYDKYYYKKQNDLWWLGTIIFLSTIDAFVDAHLFDFEEKKKKIHLKFSNNALSLSYNF